MAWGRGRGAPRYKRWPVSRAGGPASHSFCWSPTGTWRKSRVSRSTNRRARWRGLSGRDRSPWYSRGGAGGCRTSHRGMARLVRALGEPVTSTSANLPGSPPAPGAEAIVRDFAPAVEAGTLLVLDGGVLGNSPPSTVVDCTQPTPRLIPEGALTLGELRRAAGRLAP